MEARDFQEKAARTINPNLYDYEIEPLPKEPGKYGCWIMHIYNIETREEVAVYK